MLHNSTVHYTSRHYIHTLIRHTTQHHIAQHAITLHYTTMFTPLVHLQALPASAPVVTATWHENLLMVGRLAHQRGYGTSPTTSTWSRPPTLPLLPPYIRPRVMAWPSPREHSGSTRDPWADGPVCWAGTASPSSRPNRVLKRQKNRTRHPPRRKSNPRANSKLARTSC